MPSKPIERPALYVVATPIGNLADLSPRARDVLAAVDAIFAEDTRHTAGLCAHHGIHVPLVSMHEHNERARAEQALERLTAGQAIALVSDAGTPCISDPGYRMVAAARATGVKVIPIPGPCAAIAALSAGGLPTDRFVFVGFLPHGAGERRAVLAGLAAEPGTLVMYESPQRIARLLGELHQAFGARPIVVGRELTKLHEELVSGVLGQLDPTTVRPQGEVTVLVGGAAPTSVTADDDQLPGPAGALLEATHADGIALSQAVRWVSEAFDLKRRSVYRHALRLWGDEHG